MADSLGDSLDQALEGAFTRRIPQSAQAQVKYLVKQLKGTKAAAQALGVSQGTVERYVAGKFKRPRRDLRDRIEREVKKRWQPQIRATARKTAASTGGLVVSTRARFGFEAAGAVRPTTPACGTSPRPCRLSGPTACSPPGSRAPTSSSSADRGRRPRAVRSAVGRRSTGPCNTGEHDAPHCHVVGWYNAQIIAERRAPVPDDQRFKKLKAGHTLARHGHSHVPVAERGFTAGQRLAAMSDLLARHLGTDDVFAVNDLMAQGACGRRFRSRSCARIGRRVARTAGAAKGARTARVTHESAGRPAQEGAVPVAPSGPHPRQRSVTQAASDGRFPVRTMWLAILSTSLRGTTSASG